MSERLVCIHGHFYQPPRENPWLDHVELQDSAYPFHDWNERITAECYGPNSTSRVLDSKSRVLDIVNNYARMSWNFGPTLLRYLEGQSPEVYARILEADRSSRERFSGHGSALAQGYNHAILPLCNARDQRTQVGWGIADFERRFGRKPEGLWLPECAVDLATLDVLAEHEIAFTVLAPHQAARFRPLEDGAEWQDVSGARIDPSRPYLQRLPSGRTIALFFYDGPVSRAVAFEGLLASGERFAERLVSAFASEGRDGAQLVHIATDGESYGHHHKHGEMALTAALDHLERKGLAKLTNYGEHLERFPPRHEVQIVENSSWSCVHGVERWRSDCGCSSGGKPGWNQAWRGPLRAALDGLRDRLARGFEEKGGELLRDPWAARDAYVELVLERTPERARAFLDERARRPLGDSERILALELLEMQRHALLMYTSCGWFFDEVSGLEAVQVLHYAACALQKAEERFDPSLEADFLAALEKAPSNLPDLGTARAVYEKLVKPAAVDLGRVAAHYAVSSLFETYEEKARVYSFLVERQDARVLKAGKAKLSLGRVRVESVNTGETRELSYGAVHLGDHNITGGLRAYRGFAHWKELVDRVVAAFSKADLPAVIRVLDAEFQDLRYSLKSLFWEEQRKILDLVLGSTLAEAEDLYRQLYEHHAPLLRFLADLRLPLPKAFLEAATFVLNRSLREAFLSDPLDLERIRQTLDEAQRARVPLENEGLGFAFRGSLERSVARLAAAPDDRARLERLRAAVELAGRLPFFVDLARVQNVYWELRRATPPEKLAPTGDDIDARSWASEVRALGEALRFAPEALEVVPERPPAGLAA